MKIQLVLLVTCAAALKLQQRGDELEPVPNVVLDEDEDDEEKNPAWLHRGAGVHPNSVFSQFDSKVSYAQDCPDQKNVKLAVCVAGASRDFVHPEMTAGFNKFLMEAAIGAGATGLTRSKPDLFIHMHLGTLPENKVECKKGGMECGLAETREESGHNKINTMENTLAAIKDVDPTNFHVDEANGPVYNRSFLGDPSCFAAHSGHKKIEGAMAFYHNIYQCKQMLVEAEKKTGKKYDAVVLARPDYPWEFGSVGSVANKIQCSTSMFSRDLASFQTRAAFDIYSDIWLDQMVSKTYAHCHQFFNSYEAIAEEGVTQIRAKVGPALWAGKWFS